MKIENKHIFEFNGEWKLAKYPPKDEGYYMTIRCGLNGIYTCLDEWKINCWQVGVLDDSSVIAYSKEQVTNDEIKELLPNGTLKKLNIDFQVVPIELT